MENRTIMVEIDKIIVNDRIRKDFGNIEELAQDIKENGLINPPVVTPEFELIAGERRYRAMKSLGWGQIEVRVMSVQDALHKLKLEISENENRKDFSFNERMEWARILEKEYGKKAKENQLSGLNNQLSFDQKKSDDKIDTNKLVSEEVGLGGKETYRKAKYIYENADEEMIKQLDEGKLSINKCFNTLKNKAKQLEQENSILKQSLAVEKNKQPIVKEKVVDNTDYETISKLKKELEEKNKVYNLVKQNEEKYKTLMLSYQQDSNDYNKLRREIEALTKQKNSLSRDMAVIEELTPFIHNVNKLIKNELAPTKYTKAFKEAYHIDVVQNNLLDMVMLVQNWCDEILNELNIQNNDKNIINVEVK